MRTNRIGFVFFGWLAMTAGAALAQESPRRPSPVPGLPKPSGIPQQRSGDQLVRVNAFADVDQITSGKKFHLAFVFDIEPQWHIYWKNPGSAGGGPTNIKVTAPSNFEIGKTLFPRPMAIQSDDGTSYGYENRTVLYVEVTAPPEVVANQVMFNATVNWMVCKDVCLLGRSTHMITVAASNSGVPRSIAPPSSIDPAVAEFKSQLPRPLSDLHGAEAKFDGQLLTITLPAQGKSTAEFFPVEMPGVQFDEATIKADNELITITVPVRVSPHNAMGKPMSVTGIVGLGNRQTDPCYEVDIALPAP